MSGRSQWSLYLQRCPVCTDTLCLWLYCICFLPLYLPYRLCRECMKAGRCESWCTLSPLCKACSSLLIGTDLLDSVLLVRSSPISVGQLGHHGLAQLSLEQGPVASRSSSKVCAPGGARGRGCDVPRRQRLCACWVLEASWSYLTRNPTDSALKIKDGWLFPHS